MPAITGPLRAHDNSSHACICVPGDGDPPRPGTALRSWPDEEVHGAAPQRPGQDRVGVRPQVDRRDDPHLHRDLPRGPRGDRDHGRVDPAVRRVRGLRHAARRSPVRDVGTSARPHRRGPHRHRLPGADDRGLLRRLGGSARGLLQLRRRQVRDQHGAAGQRLDDHRRHAARGPQVRLHGQLLGDQRRARRRRTARRLPLRLALRHGDPGRRHRHGLRAPRHHTAGSGDKAGVEAGGRVPTRRPSSAAGLSSPRDTR